MVTVLFYQYSCTFDPLLEDQLGHKTIVCHGKDDLPEAVPVTKVPHMTSENTTGHNPVGATVGLKTFFRI